jgi:hypothetical protein
VDPISSISVEAVRFDMQKLENPEISGILYQQGTLAGYECRASIGSAVVELWQPMATHTHKKATSDSSE